MGLKAVSMAELRLEVLLAAERNGESVSEVCRRYGISRQTYYRYRRRFLGGEELGDRSRRPQRSPGQIDVELEEMICRMRRAHPRWGARRIRAELGRVGVSAPAVSTIHQVLRRNHLVADQPPRKPKALRRFERDISNELWQIDATEVVLVDQTKSYVFDLLDDHSRYLLAAIVAPSPTGEAAWDCFEDAASRYGLPTQVLSDNGLCFTGRLHGMQVDFERSLRELGVQLINARPYHPQTVGNWSASIAPSKTGSPMKVPRVTRHICRSSWTGSGSTTTGNDPTKGSMTRRPLSAMSRPERLQRWQRSAWAMTATVSRSTRPGRSCGLSRVTAN